MAVTDMHVDGAHGALLFHSTLNREHGPDCSSRLLTRSLHSPDPRSHSTELQRLCSSCSKGQFGSCHRCLLSFFSPSVMCDVCILVCADSLFGLLCLRRNGRQWGVAAGGPAHPASDSWTQSQLQLARNADARLKNVLPCIVVTS